MFLSTLITRLRMKAAKRVADAAAAAHRNRSSATIIKRETTTSARPKCTVVPTLFWSGTKGAVRREEWDGEAVGSLTFVIRSESRLESPDNRTD